MVRTLLPDYSLNPSGGKVVSRAARKVQSARQSALGDGLETRGPVSAIARIQPEAVGAVGNPAADVFVILMDIEHPEIAAEIHHDTPALTAVFRAHHPAGLSRLEYRTGQCHRLHRKTRDSSSHQSRYRRSADELTSIHGRATFVLLRSSGSMENV